MDRTELYRRRMAVKLEAWNARINRLIGLARRRARTGTFAMQQHVESLLHKRETVRNKLDKLGTVAGDGVERARRELEGAWDAMEAAWETVRTRLGVNATTRT